MRKHGIRRNMVYRVYMFLKALSAAIWFGFPSRRLHCYGVTGTDGKSTTNEMLYHLMKRGGLKVGIISTVSIDVGEGKDSNKTKLTSVSHWTFQRLLREAVKNGLTHMIVEPSSHALYQWRVRPIKFEGVGFTNLSREHLDFHWTMEHYFATKFRLFREYAAKQSIGVIPQEFAFGTQARTLSRVGTLKTFGYDQSASIWVEAITQDPRLGFILHYGDAMAQIQTTVLGAFNAENMMIATVLARYAGVSREECVQGLESFPGLPGRQEIVVSKTGVTAMIDFALTPDALTILYKAVRALGYKRQIAVFGATGNRDQGKRPLMGTVAIEHNDVVVITEDENYHEDGMVIMEAVASGIDQTSYKRGESYYMIQDRKEAIRHALSLAMPGDIVIVTGMANFTSRAMNEGNIPRDERAVIEECMAALDI